MDLNGTGGSAGRLHADSGSHFVIDSTKFAQVTPTASGTFGGLAASVG